jgi:hypothetical protein
MFGTIVTGQTIIDLVAANMPACYSPQQAQLFGLFLIFSL